MIASVSQESRVFDGAEGDVTTPVKIDVESLSSLSALMSQFGAVSCSSDCSLGPLPFAAASEGADLDPVSIWAGGVLTCAGRRTSHEDPTLHILSSKGPESECSTTDGSDLCATNPLDVSTDDAFSLMFPGQWATPDPHLVLSIGSQGHYQGVCKPCAFFHKPEGCYQMSSCPYCHLCDPNEKKRRKCDKRRAINHARMCRKGAGWQEGDARRAARSAQR